jgi:hypothetical protein
MNDNFKRFNSVLNIVPGRNNRQTALHKFNITRQLARASLYRLFDFRQTLEQFHFKTFCLSGGCRPVEAARGTLSHSMSA